MYPLCLQHKQEEADACKRRFAGDSRSDHIALLRAFEVTLSGGIFHLMDGTVCLL